ncbi:MAG: 23S rRNA (uracil(1939)-C(5))-methyltransferase RlmD [Bacilli bacterium]|nr:23S rRNA (uracil(1939)-C(5))-methyltransferase RlmD [Bacilli bacterium]
MMNSNEIKEELKVIQEHEKYKVEFISMTHDGRGVCKLSGITMDDKPLENYPIFVEGAIIGEIGIIEITQMKKSYGLGQIVRIFNDKKSPNRVTPSCPIFGECGGCQLMHLSYEGQLSFKKGMVRETLRKIGGFDKIHINDVIGMEDPTKYRNKVQVPFGELKGKAISGFYKLNSHEIIPLTECSIQTEEMTEIVKFIRNLCNEYHIKGYNEKLNKGDIRHVLIRESIKTGEVMVILICTKAEYPELDELVNKLVKRHPRIVSVMINVNKYQTNTILGNYFKVLYGRNYIIDELCGLKFKIGCRSFYQVNAYQTEKLYNKVLEVGAFKDTDVVIDAYCGIGTIGSTIAKKAKYVYGVEIVEEAIQNAKENAEMNGLTNIEFVCNKAEDQIKEWAKMGIKADAIVVDPPRKGCEGDFLKTVVEMNIPKIVYVSCDVATLARDLKYLAENGYNVGHIQPVDMFPQTNHIENVVCVTKK